MGGGNSDLVSGGEGNDVIQGGSNESATLEGGEGTDVLSYALSTSLVVLTLDATAYTDDGVDYISGFENVIGSNYSDRMTGNAAANRLVGGAGLDSLKGEGGSDTLDGGANNDSLYGGTGSDSLLGGLDADWLEGGSGADTIVGGAGFDTLTGGTGADQFLFVSVNDTGNGTRDQITDFVSGVDQVSFAGLGLTLVTGAFTGAGQIRWDAVQSRLQINLDANLAVDRQVDLTGVGAGFDASTDLIL